MSVESANESVATVAIAGNVITVTAVAPGTTKGTVIITDVDSQEVLTKDFNITCQDVVDSIVFDNEPVFPGVPVNMRIEHNEETGTLGVTVTKHNGYTVEVTSGDATKVTLSYSDGVITGTRQVENEYVVLVNNCTIAIMNGDEVVTSRTFGVSLAGVPDVFCEPSSVTLSSEKTSERILISPIDAPWGTELTYSATSSDDTVVTTTTPVYDSTSYHYVFDIERVGAGDATVTLTMLSDGVSIATTTISVTST